MWQSCDLGVWTEPQVIPGTTIEVRLQSRGSAYDRPITDMAWESRYMSGYTWCRGTRIVLKNPFGYVPFFHGEEDYDNPTFTLPNDPDHAVGDGRQVLRLESPQELVDLFQNPNSSFEFTLCTKDRLVEFIQWATDFRLDEAAFRALDIPDSVYWTEGMGGYPQFFYHSDIPGLTEECKAVLKFGAEHQVEFEWI